VLHPKTRNWQMKSSWSCPDLPPSQLVNYRCALRIML
jgi:hypothetical protein